MRKPRAPGQTHSHILEPHEDTPPPAALVQRGAVFLWAAWDGVIAAHVLPGNMGLSEPEFEKVLALSREVLALGLLQPAGAAK